MKKLNFGCGTDIRSGWDNCDVQKGKGIISFNFNKFPYPIKDNAYDLIEARQVLNFVDKPDEVLYELRRICKNKGIIKITVPYYNNKGAHNDIQTKYYFNENSFINFARQFRRIDRKPKFKLLKLEKKPTIVGKFIPSFLRDKLNLFISGLYNNMFIDFEVIK